MVTKKQSYWWLFDGQNHPKSSSWLQFTLTELDDKTKAMLKLIDEEADSFAQRAEMYYKKRPELISMVEDFYRAHRSLAERYDQLKIDPSSRLRSSPLRHSFSHFPKEEHENVLNFVKSLDTLSLTEEGFHSEIDDPELYDEKENYPFEELEKLQQENEILRQQIALKNKQNEELNNLEKAIKTVKRENAVILMNQKKQTDQKNQEIIELKRKLEDQKLELMKFRDESEIEKRHLNDVVVQKDEEKIEAIKQLSIGMEVLREENQFLKKLFMKVAPKKWVLSDIKVFKGVNFGKLFGFFAQVLNKLFVCL